MALPLRSAGRTFATSLRCGRTPALKPAALLSPRHHLSVRNASSPLRYTTAHEWVSYDGDSGLATMGITRYAQDSLGDIAYVELPTPGAEVSKGDGIGAIESVKAASDIFAPVSGVIEEVNQDLDERPALVNSSPEDEGWLCKIKASKASELDDLLDAEAYARHCEGEDQEKH